MVNYLEDKKFDLAREVEEYHAEKSWKSPLALLKRCANFYVSNYTYILAALVAAACAYKFYPNMQLRPPRNRTQVHQVQQPAPRVRAPDLRLNDVSQLHDYYLRTKDINTDGINIRKTDLDPQLFATYRHNLNRPSIMAAFDRNPLSLFLVDGVENVQRLCGWRFAAGCQLPGTNAVLLLSTEPPISQMHELTHYLFAITNDRFGDTSISIDCGQIKAPFNTRIDEGSTEFITRYVVTRRIEDPRYPLETRAIARVADIAGPDAVIDAYFSRNWCPVSRAFDTRFASLRLPGQAEPIGPNSFGQLVGLMNVADSGNIRAGEYNNPSSNAIPNYLNDLNAVLRQPEPIRPTIPRPRITRIESNIPPIRPQRIERLGPNMRSIRP